MLKEIFERNKYIVINTDIDGILCGLILQKYYHCEIVGFCDSKNKVWLIDGFEKSDPVYIDMYVTNPAVVSIDQHVVAIDHDHLNTINRYGTKINPNLLLAERVLNITDEYKKKYPFGTVHYLMMLMYKEGIDVDIDDLTVARRVNGEDITPADIILRADDALFNTFIYDINANEWWIRLLDNNCLPIRRLITYRTSKYPNGNIAAAVDYENMMGRFFSGFTCCRVRPRDGGIIRSKASRNVTIDSDGGFDEVTDDDGKLKDDVAEYIRAIGKIMGIELAPLPMHYRRYEGNFIRKKLTSADHVEDTFSYAFVAGLGSYSNYSYTEDMRPV